MIPKFLISNDEYLTHTEPPALKTSFVDQTWEDDDNYHEEIINDLEGTFRKHIDIELSVSYVSYLYPNQNN